MSRKPLLFKGRGAVSNPEGRFEKETIDPFDDGWGTLELEPPPIPKTTVNPDHNRSILTRNNSPDIPFDQSVNPYKGCEHGCIYCYARQSHSFLGLSPGLDFETKLFRKVNAAAQLEKVLRNPRYQVKPVTLGSNTDPYQPVEKQERVTREVLEVLAAFKHPVGILTKSALVLRDLDLLAEMAKLDLVRIAVSVTSLDNHIARIMEPRAAAPQRRIETIRALAEAGVPVGVNVAPIIPALTDTEVERILEKAAEAGADAAMYILVRLPYEVKDLFREWLHQHFPDRAEHVLSLLRQMRGGKENDPRFGARMRGEGPYAQLLRNRFHLACKRLGLVRREWNMAVHHFKPPPRAGDQMNLFDED
ncbi:MAG: PA0069 family radical SAM protein [Acidobacteriota bacterium]|nr:PA0069 family radical SAM protein [Acidobacteriota bacterium]